MTEAGWRATADTFKNAKRRGDVPVGQISSLTPDDERFISWALTRWPQWEVEALTAQPYRPQDALRAMDHLSVGTGRDDPDRAAVPLSDSKQAETVVFL